MRFLMDYLDFVKIHPYGLLVVTSGSFEEHLAKVKEVMKQLQLSGIELNIDKIKFAVTKAEYLGYIIIREGIKSDPKKLNQFSILNALRIKTE